MTDQCRQIALDHVDMMFHFYATLGYPLSLDKAAHGMGTPGKPEGMNGAVFCVFPSICLRLNRTIC